MTFTTTSNSTPAGEITSSKLPLYPEGVPSKFSSDGVVQRFPGSTTLCHIPCDSPIVPGLQAVYNALNAHPSFVGRISILPSASWHMTVVDGVCEEKHEPGLWPPGKEKQPLAESTREFSHNLRQLGLRLEDEGLAPPYRMKFGRFDDANAVGIGIRVDGATAEEEARMRRLRDELADAMGFRRPKHGSYDFHITLAYYLRHMDAEDIVELNSVFADHHEALNVNFDLGAVEFCIFENMQSFPRLFYLAKS